MKRITKSFQILYPEYIIFQSHVQIKSAKISAGLQEREVVKTKCINGIKVLMLKTHTGFILYSKTV